MTNTQPTPIPVVQLADLTLDAPSADCIRDRFRTAPRVFAVVGRYRKARKPGAPMELKSLWSMQTDEGQIRKAHENWKTVLESDLQLVEVANPTPTPQQTDPDALIVY